MSVEFSECTSSYYVNNNSWQILYKKPFDLNIFLSHIKYGRKITKRTIQACRTCFLKGTSLIFVLVLWPLGWMRFLAIFVQMTYGNFRNCATFFVR